MEKKKDTRSHWNNLFREEFSKESDRASVILAAALLDQAIETLLKAKLVPNPTQSDSLFDGGNAPISTFSAKIDLAYRIGVIPGHIARELHLVRRIRNAFAHNVTGCTFSDGSVQSRVMELAKSQGVPKSAPGFRKQLPEGPRGDFQITCSWLSWQLWHFLEEVQSISTAEDFVISQHTQVEDQDETEKPESD